MKRLFGGRPPTDILEHPDQFLDWAQKGHSHLRWEALPMGHRIHLWALHHLRVRAEPRSWQAVEQ